MKQAFVYPGGPGTPDGKKAKAWGITRLFWEARDSQANAALLSSFRTAGIGVGLTRDPSWDGLSAIVLAETMHQDLTNFGFGANTGPDSCAAMFDDESHSAPYISAVLTRWRQLRPTRTTLWTFEPLQGGWFSNALVAQINSDPNLILVPQLYLGTPRMYPVSERAVCDELINIGIRQDRVVSYYDGEKEIPYKWNGIIFDFLKIPTIPPV